MISQPTAWCKYECREDPPPIPTHTNRTGFLSLSCLFTLVSFYIQTNTLCLFECLCLVLLLLVCCRPPLFFFSSLGRAKSLPRETAFRQWSDSRPWGRTPVSSSSRWRKAAAGCRSSAATWALEYETRFDVCACAVNRESFIGNEKRVDAVLCQHIHMIQRRHF